ncbi:hypothetical protein Bpfe_004475, partial [Biomphalaria pfeifferi]
MNGSTQHTDEHGVLSTCYVRLASCRYKLWWTVFFHSEIKRTRIWGFLVWLRWINIPTGGVRFSHNCYPNKVVSQKDYVNIVGFLSRDGLLSDLWSGVLDFYIEPVAGISHKVCGVSFTSCSGSQAIACRCTSVTSFNMYFSVTIRLTSEMNNSRVVAFTSDEVNFTSEAATIKLEPDVWSSITFDNKVANVQRCMVDVSRKTQTAFTFCVMYAIKPRLTYRYRQQEVAHNDSGSCLHRTLELTTSLVTLTLSYLDECGRSNSFVCYLYSDVLIYLQLNNTMVDIFNCSASWPQGQILLITFCASRIRQPKVVVTFNGDTLGSFQTECANVTVQVSSFSNTLNIDYSDSSQNAGSYDCYISGVKGQGDFMETMPYDWSDSNEMKPRSGFRIDTFVIALVMTLFLIFGTVSSIFVYEYYDRGKRKSPKQHAPAPYKISSKDILGDVYTGPSRIK